VTREDFRRELGDAFDAISGSPSPALPDRVRAALAEDAPERHGPVWIAALAAAVIAVILVGVLLVGNPLNRPPATGGHGTPSGSPAPATSPSPSPTPAPFICSERSAISASTTPPPLTLIDAVRWGTHADVGYDRLTIEFQNGQPGLIDIRTQANTKFTRSPRGDTVTLAGKDGILIVIHTTDGHTAYTGPTDVKTGFRTGLLEVQKVEDSEGVVQWAMGLGVTPCYRASILSNPTRLVVDIKTS
jgi:hypothetical protein